MDGADHGPGIHVPGVGNHATHGALDNAGGVRLAGEVGIQIPREGFDPRGIKPACDRREPYRLAGHEKIVNPLSG